MTWTPKPPQIAGWSAKAVQAESWTSKTPQTQTWTDRGTIRPFSTRFSPSPAFSTGSVGGIWRHQAVSAEGWTAE